MKRTFLNLLVDMLAFLAAGALVGTGLLLAYRLPPGHGNRLAILNWTRHEWGDIHLILAWVVIGLVVIHLLLHLDWLVHVCSEIGHRCGALGRRWVLPTILLIATGILIATPLLLPIRPVADVAFADTPAAGTPAGEGTHAAGPSLRLASGRSVEVRGNMTLNEVALLIGLDGLQLRRALKVATGHPGNRTLKDIAVELDITMSDVRERIQTAIDGTLPPTTGVSP